MKKFILSGILILSSFAMIAQSPGYFNYQAVIRDNAGNLITDQNVSFRISILKGDASGAEVYSERHDITSNTYGICNLIIGTGTAQSSDFDLINWGHDKFFIQMELDEQGGSDFTNLGAVQLLSVPYSFYANMANKANEAVTATNADTARNLANEVLYFTETDTLFAVKDRDGNIVFAVYPDGAAVYVNNAVKGKVGGFAVSGRSPSKAVEEDYLIVTADSTRVYVNQSATKGKVGGFAISGRSPSKGTVDNFLDLTPQNYFIGHESGQKTLNSPDFGNYNVFLGYQTGMENLTGSQNVFIGYKTAQANTHGMSNVYIGSKSGFNNSLGYDNVFIGSSSGYTNSEGLYNVFLGSRSGYSNQDGDDNVFVGFESGYSNTVGIMNTFIGNKVGRANVDGSDNIFIGELAGYSNVSGSENIFIGKRAGNGVENSEENTFIGSYSGQQTTSGTKNTFLGHGTGLGNTTGSQNTYLGSIAANRNDTGSENVAVGYNAGGWSYGNNNVYVGVAAGMNALGDSSVFIGYNAGFSSSGSQKLYIENSSSSPLIYGDFKTDELVINGSLNYGSAIGTDTYAASISSIIRYIEGMALYIKFENTNTGASTISVNGLDPKSIVSTDGSDLSSGELKTGGIHLIIYDGTKFQLITY
ncbi:MAG TPA: hypothetical protein DCG75_03635 [Bacteroidales bacterium]|nr:hypothetical protein [Bacteroidales bacterium]